MQNKMNYDLEYIKELGNFVKFLITFMIKVNIVMCLRIALFFIQFIIYHEILEYPHHITKERIVFFFDYPEHIVAFSFVMDYLYNIKYKSTTKT